MDISITCINNSGELTGYFSYGKYNQKQKRFMQAGYKTFFWDGTPHLISLPSDIFPPEVLKVNNRGIVLVRNKTLDNITEYVTETTYLWSINDGFKILPDFYGNYINDNSTVLGFKKEKLDCCCKETIEIPTLWNNENFITIAELLKVENIKNISPRYSDNFSVESLSNFVGINNKGQIACMGIIWDEQHPCILEPIKK